MDSEQPIEDQMDDSIDETDAPEMSSKLRPLTSKGTSQARPHTPAIRIAKAAVVAGLLRGLSVQDAAKAAGVARRTVMDWKGYDEEFQEMLSDAEEEVIAALRSEAVEASLGDIRELMPDASKVLTNAIRGGDKRLAMQAATIVLRYSAADASTETQLETMLRSIDAKPTDGD